MTDPPNTWTQMEAALENAARAVEDAAELFREIAHERENDDERPNP